MSQQKMAARRLEGKDWREEEIIMKNIQKQVIQSTRKNIRRQRELSLAQLTNSDVQGPIISDSIIAQFGDGACKVGGEGAIDMRLQLKAK